MAALLIVRLKRLSLPAALHRSVFIAGFLLLVSWIERAWSEDDRKFCTF